MKLKDNVIKMKIKLIVDKAWDKYSEKYDITTCCENGVCLIYFSDAVEWGLFDKEEGS